MATLEKIRSKAGLLVLVVGVALFAFIIGDFLNSGSTYFRQSQETVAEVDGEVIKIQEFQDRVDEMTEMYKMQTGSTSLPEEYQTQIRQSVFDGMVQDIVLNEATSELGMGVGPEELFDMVQGENISPMIQQMQMFVNPQTGAFDKTALLNFLKTIDDDNIANYPADQQAQLLQGRQFWMFWEKNIKRQRLEQKYTTLLSKAVCLHHGCAASVVLPADKDDESVAAGRWLCTQSGTEHQAGTPAGYLMLRCAGGYCNGLLRSDYVYRIGGSPSVPCHLPLFGPSGVDACHIAGRRFPGIGLQSDSPYARLRGSFAGQLGDGTGRCAGSGFCTF